MSGDREDIPPPESPSNPGTSPSENLREALREAAAAEDPASALRAILRRGAASAGADRAFLAVAGERRPDVAAALVSEDDDRAVPSLTVLRRALGSRRPMRTADASRDPRLADAASVRALGIRSVAAFPVSTPDGPAALVFERRSAGALPRRTERAVSAFASLCALILARGGTARPLLPPEEDLVGSSPAFRDARERIGRAARTALPVLLLGESGTGKEALAREVHRRSPRCGAPFVAVNCAAVPEALLEAELFGASRGAYTGAERDRAGLFRAADGGTLFLDEVGDMPASMQAKLLRALQDGRVRPLGALDEVVADVRVVAATHRDLGALASSGRFRGDLYHRLAVVTVRVPALRERAGDVPFLAARLVERLARRHGLRRVPLEPSALRVLTSYSWPGNVRELESALARALLASGGAPLGAGHFDLPGVGAAPGPRNGLEREWIERALAEEGGSVAGASRRIGWTRQKLYRRMGALGITPRRDAEGRSPR